MKALIAQVAPSLIDALTAILGPVITLVFARLATFIAAHAKNTAVQGVLVRLNDAVETAVLALEQTMVMTAKAAAGGGKMPKEIAAQVKQAALDEVKSHLGDKGLAELQVILGVHKLDLDAFLATRIEATVMDTSVPSDPVVPPSA
jgi:hypothetical protein